MDVYDSVVVGGGPAGLTAAIYLARFNRSVIVADHGSGRSTTHEVNENYPGFPDGIASRELRERTQQQAARFGAHFAECKIESVERDGDLYLARDHDTVLRARTVVLATGVSDYLPDFENVDVQEYFGKTLFWCITCDGYKVRDRRVAVVGATDPAATTALQFLNFTPAITLITNREPGAAQVSEEKHSHLADAGIGVVEGEIACLYGEDGIMHEVELVHGERIELDVMFNQQGARPNSTLARQLDVETDERGYIKLADPEQRTNVERVYAAGDVTRDYAHQIVAAAHEGATAGISANYDLYRPEQRAG
jgi:thioredoxin reductase (NADPH)